MPTLNKVFAIGKLTPRTQHLTVSSADVDSHDLDLLRHAVTQTHGGAEVELKTEHGLWTFVVMGGEVGHSPERFELQSSGGPR